MAPVVALVRPANRRGRSRLRRPRGRERPAGRQAAATGAFEVRRGTNISHWLSQSDRRCEARRQWFTRDDVVFLARLGFDHLRIPVDEEQLWDDQGQPIPEAFGLLDAALDWTAELGLRAVVDLHILRCWDGVDTAWWPGRQRPRASFIKGIMEIGW